MKKVDGYDIVDAVREKFAHKQSSPEPNGPTLHDFIFKHALTFDPHWESKGKKSGTDNFPAPTYIDRDTGLEKEHYLSIIIKVYEQERLLLLAKSRQLMVSWLFCAISLWVAMYKESQAIFFVSKKEDDAGLKNPLSLLARSKFIYDHLEIDKPLLDLCKQPPIMRFPEINSFIHGVSQDSEALRMYTASMVFNDEWAFQDNAEDAYAALRPTVAGGGRIIGVSTPNGKQNLFYKLTHDKTALDEQ